MTPTDQPDTSLAAIRLDPSGAIELRTMADCVLTARFYAAAGMLPASHRSIEQAAIAIQAGRELGWQPLQSLGCICVINGRPSIHSQGIPAVCGIGRDVQETLQWLLGDRSVSHATATAALADDKQAPDVGCCVEWTRGHATTCRTFTVREARQAGLLSKPGPWQLYTLRMLYCRARSWVARDLCADRLMGMGLAEVLPSGEIVSEHSELEAPPTPIAPPRRVEVEVTETKRPPVPAAADDVLTPESSPPPPLPASPVPDPRCITEPMRKRLFAIANEHGIGHDELKALLAARLNVASTRDIPLARYDEFCDWLDSGASLKPEPGTEDVT